MSRFGDNNFKSDIYENLNWLVGDEPLDQLNFLHNNIIELAINGSEYVNDFIVNSIKERNLTIEDTLGELGQIYSSIAELNLINETT